MTETERVKSSDILRPHVESEVNASLFGLSPERENNAAAFAAALSFCKENALNRLVIDAGVYYFEITQSFILKDVTNFELYAPDVRFVFYSPIPNTEQITFFRLENCSVVQFTGLSIDWDNAREPLATPVCAEAVTEDYVDLRTADGGEIADSSLFITLNAVNPETFTPGVEDGGEYNVSGNQRESFAARERLKKGLYRCYYKRGASGRTVFHEGFYYLVRHYTYNGGIFLIFSSTHITFEDVTVFGSPGSGFDVRGRSCWFYFHRMRVTLPDYEKRYISTTVDAVFLAGTDGHMLFEDCDIGYQGDDAVNIHNGVWRGAKRLPDKPDRFVLRCSFRVGDKIGLANTDLTPMNYSAQILAKEPVGDAWCFTLDKPLPDAFNSESIVYDLSFDSSDFVIRGCRFHENRARGILVQADRGLIENCEFYHTQGAAIQIETGISSSWAEGRGVSDVVIRNNKMIGCDVNDWDRGVIYMSTYLSCGIPVRNSDYPNQILRVGEEYDADCRTDYPLFRNITIEGNLIEEYPRRAMILTSFKGLTLTNNTFVNNKPRRHNNPDRGSILIAYGSGVNESGNVFLPSPNMMMPKIERR